MLPASLSFVRIKDGLIVKDQLPLMPGNGLSAEDVYRAMGCSYPKFFKMDLLCKWAWLAAETLLRSGDGFLYDGADKNRIAVVLATKHGCLAVDMRYQETMSTIPSPALFVYTLPNIMLGELCIRHGFKGEQLCLVQEAFNEQEIIFWVQDLFKHRGMEHCLFGWVDAVNEKKDVCLFWASAKDQEKINAEAVSAAYHNTT